MKKPPLPSDESIRLAKLNALGIIYSPAEERFDRITKLARTGFGVPIALITLVSEKCQWFKSSQGSTAAETSREISLCAHAILQDDTFVVPDASQDPDFSDNPLVTGEPFIRFYAGHPLKYEGSAMGTLCIIDRVPRQLSPSELETLRNLAAWAENELKTTALGEAQTQLLKELDETKRITLIDPLTKVWNRNGMDVLMHREIERARRERQRVVLMMLDVDNFKDVNDRYGHHAGDVALKEIAQRIRLSVRPSDVIVRYGGDEFLLFAADCPVEMSKILAQRILSRVRDEPIEADTTKFNVSMTIGVSSAVATKELDAERLTKLADKALYHAKAAGRNCIRFKSQA